MIKMKQFAPSAARNKDAILEVLTNVVKENFGEEYAGRKLLEISSGTGQHTAHFAPAFPKVTFQPSEYEKSSLPSIDAYVKEANLTNVLPALNIDISKDSSSWPVGPLSSEPLDIMLCINMIHITPYECTQGLFKSASKLLKPGGLLVTYGAYSFDGVISPDSNVKFDGYLKAKDPSWGLRDVTTLKSLGELSGLKFITSHSMPSNNHTLVFKKF